MSISIALKIYIIFMKIAEMTRRTQINHLLSSCFISHNNVSMLYSATAISDMPHNFYESEFMSMTREAVYERDIHYIANSKMLLNTLFWVKKNTLQRYLK